MGSRNKWLAAVFLLVFGLAWFGLGRWRGSSFYDVVIFGGGFGGCAAAVTAAGVSPEISVLLVVQEAIPGGLGTVGGQNFLDLRLWREELISGGSLSRWYQRLGQFYSTAEAAELLAAELATHENITVLYSKDLEAVQARKGRITALSLREVVRGSDGAIGWGDKKKTVRGNVFVDASEEGRLARLAGVSLVKGRGDWPEELLPAEERNGAGRQQAATLMFKIQGVALPEKPGRFGDIFFARDKQGSWGVWGGLDAYREDEVVTVFNRTYGQNGFAIKPFNIAQNGAGSNEWWVNMLLVFNVDGRAHRRDLETNRFPADKRPEQLDTDTAYISAREFLQNPAFIQALRRFSHKDEETGQAYGFQEAELVLDEYGQPVTGGGLYLRETVHMVEDGRDEVLFALTPSECQTAGVGPDDGGDLNNYASRVGLAFYAMDINAYKYTDLLQENRFIWPVTEFLRPDWQASGGEPENPVYLPYEMLITETAENLLLPGYATGASSLAWAALRVLPNLTVLGDAAGAAAALSVEKKIPPFHFGETEVAALQEILRKMGATLEK